MYTFEIQFVLFCSAIVRLQDVCIEDTSAVKLSKRSLSLRL